LSVEQQKIDFKLLAAISYSSCTFSEVRFWDFDYIFAYSSFLHLSLVL
jgi:hypothetical protein